MLVIERMTHNPVTVTGDTTVRQALQIIEERELRHLPVMDEGDVLVGIVAEKELLRASGDDPVQKSMFA